MGWGKFTLHTDQGGTPGDLLAGFNRMRSHIVCVGSVKGEGGFVAYELETDCGVTVYCSNCGKRMCVGCGSAPTFVLGSEGPSASCTKDECLAALDEYRRGRNGAG